MRAQFAVAGTIPTTIQTSSQSASSPSIIPTLLSATSSPSTSAISAVAQHQPHTGNNYALDPFGLLHSTQQGEQETAGGDNQGDKHTSTARAPEQTTDSATTASKPTGSSSSSTVAGHSGTENRPEASTSARPESDTTQPSATQPTNSPSAPTSTAPSEATHTQKEIDPDSDSSSGTGMDAWKMIGIGVVSVAGVALLVIGTAFHDAIFKALCGPFRRRKEGEEILVPDWRRGSWRFGDDDYGLEKSSDVHHQDEEMPRIPGGEKGNLAFPLPPVSPFPLRRTPSTNTRMPEPGLAGVGAGGVGMVKSQGGSYSVPPSPPGLRAQGSSRSKRKSVRGSPAPSHDGHESDAYGGIE